MCEYCEKNKKPDRLLADDVVDVYLDGKFESKGILVSKTSSWYRPEPYTDFVCPKSVTEDNRRRGKDEGTFVMAIKEKWLVKLIDLPNQPVLSRWIPKYHSTGIVHVADVFDEDSYRVDTILINEKKYDITEDIDFCIESFETSTGKKVRSFGEFVFWNDIKEALQSDYIILQASCKNLRKTFELGDVVSSDLGLMTIDKLLYHNKNDIVYAMGKIGKMLKIELCELEHSNITDEWIDE